MPKKNNRIQKMNEILIRAQMRRIPSVRIAEFLDQAYTRCDFIYIFPEDIFLQLVDSELKERENEPS